VPEHEHEPVAEALPDLLDDRVGATAVRALEVAVLDERELRAEYAQEVVVAADPGFERNRGLPDGLIRAAAADGRITA
jgi:hypothetical protein